MCIIASIPAGSKIDDKTLTQMWNSNPDGGGIAYIEDGKVKTYKSMKLKKFKSNFFRILDEHGDSDILVHTRIATHGSICIPNVHPFKVMQDGKELDNLVFAHNGILPNPFIPPAKLDISDTRYINEVLFNGTDFDTVLDDSRWREMIGDIIGHNKFVFLSANPAHKQESYIINAHLGEYDGKVWYSNSSYCKPKYKIIKSSTTVGNKWKGYKPTSRDSYDDSYVDPITGEISYWAVNGETETYDPAEEFEILQAERRFDDGYTYDGTLLNDPSFVATSQELLANTGYQTIEHALEGLWVEIDDTGIFRCFDCEQPITVKGIRTCKPDCEVGDMIADATELEAAHKLAKSDYDKAKKKAKKVKQQKLPLKHESEDVAPF